MAAYAEGESAKDWQGRDKGQHAQIGFVTAGTCAAIFKTASLFNMPCFAASGAFGLAEQLYAYKTNQAKCKREGAYDFLADVVGAGLGVTLVNSVIFIISRKNSETTLNISTSF